MVNFAKRSERRDLPAGIRLWLADTLSALSDILCAYCSDLGLPRRSASVAVAARFAQLQQHGRSR
jgi:hypothetical protein